MLSPSNLLNFPIAEELSSTVDAHKTLICYSTPPENPFPTYLLLGTQSMCAD